MFFMWNYGDVIVWREIFRGCIWRAQTSIVVKDSDEEIVQALVPGAEGMVEPSYFKGKQAYDRRWKFKENDWDLVEFKWHTNRVLMLTEPEAYYSTLLFWNHAEDRFLGYYINFQLPFLRNRCGMDTLDLDLDIVIAPDLTFEWKDEEDYRSAISHGAVDPEWVSQIEAAKPEIFERIARKAYPFDGSWLDWKPDVRWKPPVLPEGWERI